MIFPTCTILILIALCTNTVNCQVVLTSVNSSDLAVMSNLLAKYSNFLNPKSFWNLFCDSSYQPYFSNITTSTIQEKNVLLTLKNINNSYPSFCQNTSLKSIFSLFPRMVSDTAIKYSICQTSIGKVNLNGSCDQASWTDSVMYQVYSNSFINSCTRYLCNNIAQVHEGGVLTNQYGPLLDQFIIDLSTSPTCVNSQWYIVEPVSFISNTVCKTPSGLKSNLCQFVTNSNNIAALCQGFLNLNGSVLVTYTSNITSMVGQWLPPFGSLANNTYFVGMVNKAAYYVSLNLPVYVSNRFIPFPKYTIRQLLCVDPLICPPVTPTCP